MTDTRYVITCSPRLVWISFLSTEFSNHNSFSCEKNTLEHRDLVRGRPSTHIRYVITYGEFRQSIRAHTQKELIRSNISLPTEFSNHSNCS